jgi:hypothetical protein
MMGSSKYDVNRPNLFIKEGYMYKQYFAFQDTIGLSNEETDSHEIAEKFNAATNTMEDENLKKLLIWNCELFSLYLKSPIENAYDKRLNPMYELVDGTKWPDIDKFEPERLDFYRECEKHTQNLAMKVRYLEYLFELEKSKYNTAIALLENLIQLGKIRISDDDVTFYLSFYSCISRVVEISIKFNLKKYIKISENIFINEIRNINNKESYRWIMEASFLLFKMAYDKKEKLINQETIDELMQCLEKAKDHFLNNKQYDLFQAICNHLIMWIKKSKLDQDKVNELQSLIGEAYELESIYQQGRKDKSKTVETHFLELAIKHYLDTGQNQRVPRLKVLLKKAYQELAQNGELKLSTYTTEVSQEAIDNCIEPVIGKNVKETFEIFALIPYFVPQLDAIKQQANKIRKDSVYHLFANSVTFKDGRKVSQATSEDEHIKKAIDNYYMLHLQLTFISLVQNLFDKMLNQGLTADIIISRINNWEYLDESKKPIIERGIRRFFEGDYISSIHILVPTYEYCFREFFFDMGFPTTSFKSNTIQFEQTFNDFLMNNEFIKECINEDELYMIRMIMVEQNGLNLRNNVAHGLVGYDSLNKPINLMIIYLFLLLVRYEIVEKGESND